jgi:hypothetical protein
MAKVVIGAVEYDSFGDVAFADEFLAGDVLRAGPWALRNPDAKARGMVSATRLLLRMPWCEAAPGFDAAPAVVQEANAMLASDMLAKPRLFSDASTNSNIRSVRAGSAQVEFFAPVAGAPPLPIAVWSMLSNAGLLCLGSSDGEGAGAIVTGISDGCRPLGGRPLWDYPIAAEDCD